MPSSARFFRLLMHPKKRFFEPILFFLCQKEKNGFGLPRKERGLNAYRCPEFDSEKLSCQLSVTSVTTTRKVSALCASPFGGASSQNRAKAFPFGEGTERSEADEGRGAKTMHCAVGRVLHTLIRPFGPPSPRGRPSAARGKTPSVCAERRQPPLPRGVL